MGEGDTLINALIGGAVAFVVSLIPVVQVVATIIGGGVAGYLQKRGVGGGAKVGALAGIFGAVPAVIIVVIATTVLGAGFLSAGVPIELGGALGFFVLVILIVVAIFAAVFGAIGGAIGGVISKES